MTLHLTCAQCGRKYKAKDADAGKTTTCSGCGHELTIPQPSVAPADETYALAEEPGSVAVRGPESEVPHALDPCPRCGSELGLFTRQCVRCGFGFPVVPSDTSAAATDAAKADSGLSFWQYYDELFDAAVEALGRYVHIILGSIAGFLVTAGVFWLISRWLPPLGVGGYFRTVAMYLAVGPTALVLLLVILIAYVALVMGICLRLARVPLPQGQFSLQMAVVVSLASVLFYFGVIGLLLLMGLLGLLSLGSLEMVVALALLGSFTALTSFFHNGMEIPGGKAVLVTFLLYLSTLLLWISSVGIIIVVSAAVLAVAAVTIARVLKWFGFRLGLKVFVWVGLALTLALVCGVVVIVVVAGLGAVASRGGRVQQEPQNPRQDPAATAPSLVRTPLSPAEAELVQERWADHLHVPREIATSSGMKLVLIPPRESVGPFYLSINEVTQAQYENMMEDNPSNFKGPTHPVERVSWDDAVKFCQRLSETEGREFRLPTGNEWEHACRAGSLHNWCFGDDVSVLGAYAWYGANSAGTTHPVGQKKPNAWGLCDMHGNLWEWCADWTVADEYRAGRGGGWDFDAESCRSASCTGFEPSLRSPYLGFRVAAAPADAGNKSRPAE